MKHANKKKKKMLFWKLFKSKNVQLVTFIVKGYGTCEFKWNDLWTLQFLSQRNVLFRPQRPFHEVASIINFSFLTNTSMSPGWVTWTIFSSLSRLRRPGEASDFVLLYAVSLLFPPLLMQYLLSACAIQPDFEVAANKNHIIFRHGHGIREC